MTTETTQEPLVLTDEERAQWADKIRKLLAKAEAQGVTDEERDAFQNKAAALMIKMGISDAMIGKVDPAKINDTEHATTGPKIYQREYISMGIKIARAFGVKGFISQYRTHETLGLIGFDDDVARTLLIWRSLETQLTMALAAAVAKHPYWSSWKASQKFNFKRAFILGFGQEVGDRLIRIYAEVVEAQTSAAPGTAVVLANRKDQVEEWTRRNMHLTTTASRQYDGGGMHAGRTAGAKADVGQSGMTQGTGQHALGN